MEQTVSDRIERRRILNPKSLTALLVTAVAIVQTAWIGALAWVVYQVVKLFI